MANKNRTSNFKPGNPEGTRREGSIVGDSMDVAFKAALTTPKQDGPAPGEGTIASDPKVQEAREDN